jgi:membrane protease YdiL (CAAX protease family)
VNKVLTPASSARPDAQPSVFARRPLLWFFVLAFGLSWPLLLLDFLGSRGLIPFRLSLSGPGLALTLLMAYAPTLAALVVVGATAGRAGVGSLLGAAVRWRVGLRWYAVALAGPPALFFVAARLSELLGGAPRPLPVQGWAVLVAGLVNTLVHGIANGEELGWRGYALPQLMERQRALSASLTLGLIWFVFHVPIMFVPNSIAGGQSLETALPFLVTVLAASVLMTWLYRGTGGSVLIPWLFHGAVNAWPGLVGGAGSEVQLAWIQAALIALAAAAVVARYGPDLARPGLTARSRQTVPGAAQELPREG